MRYIFQGLSIRFILSLAFIAHHIAYAQKKRRRAPETPPPQNALAWQKAISSFTRGVVLFSQGLTEEAAEHLEKAAEAAPNSAGIHYYLSRIAYLQDDPIRMLIHAEKAYKESPRELWLALGYAAALQLNNQHKEACALLEKLAKAHPDQPEIILRLAQAYHAAGDVDKADAYYAQLQHMTGSYEEIFQTRLQLLIEKGRIQQAISIAESLATLFPRHELYLESAARLYELSRDMRGMASATSRLLDIDPANQVAWDLVLSYYELFEDIWGTESWERLLDSSGVPAEIKYMILRRVDFLEEDDFISILRKLLSESPAPSGWDLYARYWAYHEKWDSAAQAWKRAIRMDSTQIGLYSDYFYALYKLGGGDSLLQEVEQVLELLPGQGRLYLWEGIARMLTRSPKEAIMAFQKGWRLHQSVDTPLTQIAAYYHAMAESVSGNASPDTRRRLQQYYPTSIGEALWHIFLLRQKNTPPTTLPKDLSPPSPYNYWIKLLQALREGKVSESYTYASIVVNSDFSLPLEMWEDILIGIGQRGIGADYARWKQKAQRTYPLAALWKELP
ncbi:MAG: tetratricopeptide repeat protein [Bacteroidia bacterium]|nr:tetratricopeptide repeat protein [Bacteroidia bacterium]MCX7651961.1 tetratricopeptide repeat protein [Bacteroidia bacterium]MDW8416112.1 tetratricopeptide repeat protein [Bacteroidia bacterium]